MPVQGSCTRIGVLSRKKVSKTGGWIFLSPASRAGVCLTAALLVHTPVTALGSSERSTGVSAASVKKATSVADIGSTDELL